MKEKVKSAVMASFMGDALSLGVHWIYNTHVIDKKYGRVEYMLKPELAKFHAGKEKGAFTHYGDQMMILLKSIAEKSGFNLKHFSTNWQELFKQYQGYFDQATKDTIANFEMDKAPQESGSTSSELGGAARVAPLMLCYFDNLDAFISAARAQTAMTHNHNPVIACAEIFSRASYEILYGTPPMTAILKTVEAISPLPEVADGIRAGFDSREKDTRQAILHFGQMCEVEAALPSTIHLIAKYENDPKQALIENIMAGGDSAARGMLVGFILGCSQGSDWIPKKWIDDLVLYDEIVRLMNQVLKT
jgi:ADP-ribosylglycohydrolase